VAAADRLSGLLPESLSVDPWERVELTFYKTMQADREAMFVTLGIVVFIVCIGVLNTVLMSVLERTREFGVLKAIGTRPGRIAWMVLTENAILSGLSCLLGLFLALPIVGFMTIVGFELAEPMDVGGVLMSHVRGEFSLRIFAVPFALVVTTAVLVSIPPGIRAARILPIQALAST
jgi:ABC-type lipoprotein release transport system permease subunit